MDTREGNAGIYAHSLPGQPPVRWETLDAHASRVARLAREFAEAFGAGVWGELLGRWHDAGKTSREVHLSGALLLAVRATHIR